MTTDKDFKRLVRGRARKTGESYALARRRLLVKAGGTPVPQNPEELDHILELSEDQARILGHDFIGTEHILLALIADEGSVAAEVLGSFEVTIEQVRSKIEETIGSTGVNSEGSLPQTPRAKKAIQYAEQEVVDLGHSSVGSGHLLLGIVKEGSGVAILVLDRLGVDVEHLPRETLRKLGVGDA